MNSKAIRKQLFAAVAMVLVAAVALGSSTYAWFVASGTVEATDMTVTAQAEAGIVISNNASSGYATTAATAQTKNAKLTPASTADATTWYHATSTKYNDAEAGQETGKYKTISNGDGTSYVKNIFYIKSASNAPYEGKLEITNVEITAGGEQTLDSALRVGIKITGDDHFYIYAPKTTTTTSYTVGGLKQVETIAADEPTESTISGLPASSAAGTEVDIYMWYEGEDANCNSSNIEGVTLASTSVSVTFTAKDIAA